MLTSIDTAINKLTKKTTFKMIIRYLIHIYVPVFSRSYPLIILASETVIQIKIYLMKSEILYHLNHVQISKVMVLAMYY